MQICIVQRDGTRYFNRFKKILERDRIEVELTIEDSKPKVYNFDLTDAFFEAMAQHPEIGAKKPAEFVPMESPTEALSRLWDNNGKRKKRRTATKAAQKAAEVKDDALEDELKDAVTEAVEKPKRTRAKKADVSATADNVKAKAAVVKPAKAKVVGKEKAKAKAETVESKKTKKAKQTAPAKAAKKETPKTKTPPKAEIENSKPESSVEKNVKSAPAKISKPADKPVRGKKTAVRNEV